MAFGDRCAFVDSQPRNYLLDGMTQAMQWRRKRFGLDGMRLDDTKGTAVSVTRHFLNALGGFNFCETFTGDPRELQRFVQLTGANTMDFTLHFALQGVCNAGVSLRSLPGNGFYAWDAEHAVLFVESADTDLNNGQNIRFNKPWAYHLSLTLPARATQIYAGDYLKYGLAPQLNQMMWVSAMFAFGALRWELVEDDVLVWSRDGNGGAHGWSGGLLCGFSRNPVATEYRWVHTPFGPKPAPPRLSGPWPRYVDQPGWLGATAITAELLWRRAERGRLRTCRRQS